MSKVTLTTELPIPAAQARELAAKPELMRHVLAPYLKISRRLQMPEKIEPGLEAAGRLWWFGVIPAWRHHIKVVRLDPLEIYTNEWGGPVRTWNHRLTFVPTGDHSCSYTDEIEVDDGVRGWGTRGFVLVMFRHRHRRWQALARILTVTSEQSADRTTRLA
jgi:ligand-binding SRPBCC domain-containing protein